MKTAFIYAGQGSQAPGMGADLYEACPAFAAAFDEADPTGRWRTLCFEGTAEQLADTRNTQPCMVAFAHAMTELLASRGIRPDMCMGLSLGEYSALAAAGVLTGAQAVELVAFRGDAMARASQGLDCGMAAVMHLDEAGLQQACDKASSEGVVSITNYNCPGQLVISGERAAVERACEYALESGARRCVPLNVSGPFHTSLMQPAADALRERFATVDFKPMRVPVVFNATGLTMARDETVPQLLEQQVRRSVLFERGIRFMVSVGVATTLEIGPGTVLSGFVRKIDKSVRRLAASDVESFEQTVRALSEEVCDEG